MSATASWIRSHRLTAFFALSYALSWWAMILYWVGVWPTTTFIPAGPLVAAIIVIAVAEGRAGFRDLGARILRWRVAWYWYAVALGLPLAVRIGSLLVNTGAGGAPAPDWAALAWTSFGLAVLVRLVNPMDGPVGEEPGWRGYAVPRLQATRSPLAAALILGVLVAGWHVPLVLIGDLGPVGLVTSGTITIVYVWLFNRTSGSVLLTLLFHSVQGAVTMSDLGLAGDHLVRQEFIECVIWSVVAAGVLALNPSAWSRDVRAASRTASGTVPHRRAGAVSVRVGADLRVAESGRG